MAAMPWQETDVSKERVKFVLEWEKRWNAGEGRTNFAALCREFGISRQQGYFWIRRFQDADFSIEAVVERSHRPARSPTKVSSEMEDHLAAARKAHPTWGPRKLRSWLQNRHPEILLPAASTIGEVLRRRGLTVSPKRRSRATMLRRAPFAETTGPNATWCADFKGHFRTADGTVCYPLTIVDAFSRFLIRCEIVKEPTGAEVQRVFDSAFLEFGLPSAIRSDNGPPFASVGAGGLTKLSVWWLRLGIRLERITPGKPQENGRQERFHRTLKAETTKPPRANPRAQQRAFDEFRRDYNTERPHEALGQRVPLSAYEQSPRRYPRALMNFEPIEWEDQIGVRHDGTIRWKRKSLFISSALAHLGVEIEPTAVTGEWLVHFGPLSIGNIKTTSRGTRFVPSTGRMQDTREVSGISSD